MKTQLRPVDAFRTQLTDTIRHGTTLLADLQALNDNFPTMLPSLGELAKSERATQVAALCGFDPDLPADLRQLIESLADVREGSRLRMAGRRGSGARWTLCRRRESPPPRDGRDDAT